VHSGADGSDRGWSERTDRAVGRPAGIRAVVADAAVGLPSPRPGAGSEGGRGRRRLGILEGAAASMADDATAALLGAQDGQRARQAAQESAAASERQAA